MKSLKKRLYDRLFNNEIIRENIAVKYHDSKTSFCLTFQHLYNEVKNVTNLLEGTHHKIVKLNFDLNKKEIAFIIPAIIGVALSDENTFFVSNSVLSDQIENGVLSYENGSFNYVEIQENQSHLCNKNILYCVQTSGTSGRRKTVQVPDSCILPNIEDFQRIFYLSEKDVIFSAAPPSFDPFYLDVFVSILSNATLLMTSQTVKSKGGRTLSNVLHENQVTLTQMTPSLFKSIHENVPNSLKHLILGGEPFAKINQKVNENMKIYNIYGLTEMSVWQSMVEIKDFELDQQPIKGVENLLSKTNIKLENEEIKVSSKERSCFYDEKWHFDIKTGDLGFKRGSEIFCSGRSDDVFKIHGQKLSLQEIEMKWSTVFESPSFCMITENKKLLGYIKTSKSLEELWKLSTKFLSPLIMPYALQCGIEHPPVTLNGKIDKESLRNIILQGPAYVSGQAVSILHPRQKCIFKNIFNKFCSYIPKLQKI